MRSLALRAMRQLQEGPFLEVLCEVSFTSTKHCDRIIPAVPGGAPIPGGAPGAPGKAPYPGGWPYWPEAIGLVYRRMRLHAYEP
jgi:hypothetical protein